MEKLVELEILGVGPGTTFSTTFSSVPVKPRSVKIFADYGTMTVQGLDDGTGNISGSGITGEINYATGELNLTFTTSIPSSNRVYASYFYFEYGVTDLNRVQYVQQDFQTIVEGLKSFVQENFPDEYNDYASSSIGMALLDIIGWAHQNLAWNLNRKVTDFYFPTARTPNTIAKIARMLGYKPSGATSSIATLSVTLKNGPYTFPVLINNSFAFKGPNKLRFEYRGTVPIVFNPGQTVKTIDVSEGESVVENFVADGTTNQVIKLLKVPVGKYVEDGSLSVKVNGEEWTEYPIIPFSVTKAFESNIISYPPTVKFGDGVQGVVPQVGFGIEIRYVVCSGFSGRIVKDSIKEPLVPLSANFEDIPLTIVQPSASAGGNNPEDLRSITTNAPLFQRTQDRAITKSDYDFLTSTYPNVARADAQVVRGYVNDTVMQDFVTQLSNYAYQLKQSPLYLSPRPKIITLAFSTDLFDQNTINLRVDGVLITQVFITDNDTTLSSLVAQIKTQPNVADAYIKGSDFGNVIAVTGIADVDFQITSLSVTGASAPTVTKTEVSPAPNQIWRLQFGADFFDGNTIEMTYGGTPIAIPFQSDSATTLQALGTALAGFAVAPEGKAKETVQVPGQVHEITFNKNFFEGNVIKIYVKDLSIETPIETLLQVGYRVDNATTYADLVLALKGLSFIEDATADALNRKITVDTYPYSPQTISREVFGFGNGTSTVFTGIVVDKPVKPGSFKIVAGTVIGVDDGAGNILGAGITSGTINHATGAVSITYASAPVLGVTIYCDYLYFSSDRSIEFTNIEVTLNTVSVDTTTRTVEIITDSNDSIPLTGEIVSVRTPASLTMSVTQAMVETDYGSVESIGSSLESQLAIIKDYWDQTQVDGCRANTVQVNVLARDSARLYVAPPQILLDNLKVYLDERCDVTHSVVCLSGYDKVISARLRVEVQVSPSKIEDDVVKAIENSIKKSDSKPFGILVEREFNKSLYISEIYDAIAEYLDPSDYNYLNVIITGPEQHSANFKEGFHLGVGDNAPGQSFSKNLEYIVIPSTVTIYVDGVSVANDDGNESITNIGPYAASGSVDYATGLITVAFGNALPLDSVVTASYYKSLLDERGNLICPRGYVLQYDPNELAGIPGVHIVKIPREA